MSYTHDIRAIVENYIDAATKFANEMYAVEQNRDYTAEAKARKLAELKAAQENAQIVAVGKVNECAQKFAAAAQKLNVINTADVNSDSAILQSGVVLDAQQFAEIVERNKKNAFVRALARKYVEDNPGCGFIAPLPISVIIDNFTKYAAAAASAIRNNSGLQSAIFLESISEPDGADIV